MIKLDLKDIPAYMLPKEGVLAKKNWRTYTNGLDLCRLTSPEGSRCFDLWYKDIVIKNLINELVWELDNLYDKYNRSYRFDEHTNEISADSLERWKEWIFWNYKHNFKSIISERVYHLLPRTLNENSSLYFRLVSLIIAIEEYQNKFDSGKYVNNETNNKN